MNWTDADGRITCAPLSLRDGFHLNKTGCIANSYIRKPAATAVASARQAGERVSAANEPRERSEPARLRNLRKKRLLRRGRLVKVSE